MAMPAEAKARNATRFGWQTSAAAIVAGVVMGSPLSVSGQSARPDPANAGALAPIPKYQSAFSDYRPFREEKIGSWKDVNQEVADNPGMGSLGPMKHGPGMIMPEIDSKTSDAPKSESGAAGHDMRQMK